MKKYFFKQPKNTTSFPKENYIVQQKYDGERMMMIDENMKHKLLNRRYAIKNKQFPEFNNTHLPKNTVLDGEMVVFDDKHRDNFNLLSKRTHLKHNINEMAQQYPATYMAFDILKYKNQCLCAIPLSQRLQTFKHIPPAKNIEIIKSYPLSQTRHLLSKHGEGVVFKRTDSTYEDKKDDAWLKYKKSKEADLVVTGYKEGSGKRKGMVGAVYLGVWDGKDIKPIGKAGSFKNMEENDLRQLKHDLDKYKTHQHDGNVVVKPKVFVKVQYDSMGARGNLRVPRVIGFRTDIGIRDTHASEPISDETSKNGGNLFWNVMAQHGISMHNLSPKDRKQIRRTYEKNPELLKASENLNIQRGPTYPMNDIEFAHEFGFIGEQDRIKVDENEYKNLQDINLSMYKSSKDINKDVLGQLLQHELQHRWDYYHLPFKQVKREDAIKDEREEQLQRAKIMIPFLSEEQKKQGFKYWTKGEGQYSRLPDEARAYEAEQKPRERDIQVKPAFATKQAGAFFQRVDKDESQNKKQNKIITLAYKLKRILTPLSYRIDIAGSIRRGVEPRDIDIVLVPKDKERVKERLKQLGARVSASGNTLHYSSIDGVHVDIYFANKDSYGAQLMTRTGPRGGNIGNRTLAKRKGMLLNQYGLFKGKRRIAGRTEKEIYEALGKQYKSPEIRGKSASEIRKDKSRNKEKSYVEIYPKTDEDKYYYLYHGTPIYNKDKIIQQGILPKTATGGLTEVEEILHKHNIPKTEVTKEIWKYPQRRLEETKGHIHLASDYDYALQNSLATYEAKNELEAELWRRQHPHATNKEYWEQVVKKRFQPNSAVFLVRVPKEKFTYKRYDVPNQVIEEPYNPTGQDDIVLDKVPPQDILGYTIEKRKPWWPQTPSKTSGTARIPIQQSMERMFGEEDKSKNRILLPEVRY